MKNEKLLYSISGKNRPIDVSRTQLPRPVRTPMEALRVRALPASKLSRLGLLEAVRLRAIGAMAVQQIA